MRRIHLSDFMDIEKSPKTIEERRLFYGFRSIAGDSRWAEMKNSKNGIFTAKPLR
jgi:hypothetical protein